MGNVALQCVSGGVRHVRVLLPDGNIVLLDGPVEVADLMIEHPNHMVVHCSAAEPEAIGKRPIMTIMQADQILLPGEAYLVHPIPPQYSSKKAVFKPQPLLVSKLNSKILGGGPAKQINEDGDENQTNSRRQRLTALLPKFQSKVLNSRAGADSEETKPALSDSDACSNVECPVGAVGVQLQDQEDREEEGSQVRFNIYMGWRPALESIPESPHGYKLKHSRVGDAFQREASTNSSLGS